MIKSSAHLRRFQLRVAKSFQRWMRRKTVRRVYEAESSRFAPYNIEVIKIYGSEDFVLRVSTALETLKGMYPFGYPLVQPYIHSVIEGDVDPHMGMLTGVLYEATRAVHAVRFVLGTSRCRRTTVRWICRAVFFARLSRDSQTGNTRYGTPAL